MLLDKFVQDMANVLLRFGVIVHIEKILVKVRMYHIIVVIVILDTIHVRQVGFYDKK